MDNKKYIVVKNNAIIPLSSIVNDCPEGYCITTFKGEQLSFMLKKLCVKIANKSFLSLSDTPNSYIGNEGKVVVVKADGKGLSFTNLPQGFSGDYNNLTNLPFIPVLLTDLHDFPSDYIGQAGKVLAVKTSEDGVEFIDYTGFSGDYNDLIHKPTFTGQEGIKISNTQNDFTIETNFTSNLNDNLQTIQVGGLSATTILDLKSKSLRKIIEDMVAPTLNPVLTNPDNNFSKTGGTLFETGSTQSFIFTSSFSRGSISPQYSSASSFRSGLPTSYNYTGNGLNQTLSNLLIDNQSISVLIQNGINTWTNTVDYSNGVQPLNNKGEVFLTPLPSGTTSSKSISVTGIYPFFYLKSSSPITPSIMKTSIENGTATKVVNSSTGTINITFNANGEYIAFAYPSTSTTKTVWYVNALNTGSIGGLSNLFSSESVLAINSPSSLWSNINFKIHVSNYPTSTTGVMELRNN